MDQQTLIGIGILGLLLASGGGGGDPTELIDEDDPALTGGMDEFELAAVEYNFDVHGSAPDDFDQYLGSIATRVSDWTDEFRGFKDAPSARLTQRIFDQMADLHQELKKWFAEQLSRWNTAWRRKWEDAHPRAGELFGRYGQIVKQLEVLMSFDVQSEEADTTMGGTPQQINLFNQHIGGDTYQFQTNHLTDARVNNDFKHHDQRTLNQEQHNAFDNRKFESTQTLNWGSGQIAMDTDNAVETAQKRGEATAAITDNAFVAATAPLRMHSDSHVTPVHARRQKQDLIDLDHPNRQDHQYLRLVKTPVGDEKTSEAEQINAIVQPDPEAPNLADVKETGVSIRTDADHFANAAVKVISTRKTIADPTETAVALNPHTKPDFNTIAERTGSGIDLNRPTGIAVTADNTRTKPPTATEDIPNFSATQPKVGAKGGVGTTLVVYQGELANKVQVFDQIRQQYDSALKENKGRIFVSLKRAMEDVVSFTPPEIIQRIKTIDSRFDKGFESIYSTKLLRQSPDEAAKLQLYAKSTPYFAPWRTRVQYVWKNWEWIRNLQSDIGKTLAITAGGEAKRSGDPRTGAEAKLDDPELTPTDDPDVTGLPPKKKQIMQYKTQVVDPRPRDFPDERGPFVPDPEGMGFNPNTPARRKDHLWNPQTQMWEPKPYLPASQVHGQAVFTQ